MTSLGLLGELSFQGKPTTYGVQEMLPQKKVPWQIEYFTLKESEKMAEMGSNSDLPLKQSHKALQGCPILTQERSVFISEDRGHTYTGLAVSFISTLTLLTCPVPPRLPTLRQTP